MSVHRMFSPEPDVGWDSTDPLAVAGRHARFCAVICACCADACAAEGMDMSACVSACLDCADICDATARLSTRGTGHNEETLRTVLESCARVCALCASECERHDFAACRLCAEMCRACEADCQRAVLAAA
ncbi:MAG: four-helix bundle copper-binding protein [Sphingobium sp.]|nr:four-helix bundle copper-binding protein [Sphingobium sp.]